MKVNGGGKGRVKKLFFKLFYHWQIITAPYFLNIDDSIAFLNVEFILFAACFLSLLPVFSSFSLVLSFFILRNTTSSAPFREILWSHSDCVIIFDFRSHFELEGKCLLSKLSAEFGVSRRNSTLKNLFSELVELAFKVLSKINVLILNIIPKCVQMWTHNVFVICTYNFLFN